MGGISLKVKVAIASTDGKVVNAHFGRTPQFLIFELSKTGYSFLEVRENLPSCSNLEDATGTIEDTIDLISDCQYVMASRIGNGMLDRLLSFNIIGISKPNMIEDALEDLIKNIQ